MYKILNFFFAIIVFIFLFNIFNYYSSNKNIKNINLNRLKDIIILENDTNNIIEHNMDFNEEIKSNKTRSFWNLIKPE